MWTLIKGPKKITGLDDVVLVLIGGIGSAGGMPLVREGSPQYQLALYHFSDPTHLPKLLMDSGGDVYKDDEVGDCLTGRRASGYFGGPEAYIKLFNDINTIKDFREVKKFLDKHFG